MTGTVRIVTDELFHCIRDEHQFLYDQVNAFRIM